MFFNVNILSDTTYIKIYLLVLSNLHVLTSPLLAQSTKLVLRYAHFRELVHLIMFVHEFVIFNEMHLYVGDMVRSYCG